MTLKVAIVGAGNIGTLHANVCGSIDDVQIVAIVDSNEFKGKNIARKYAAAYYPNLDELLINEKLDIVAVCTPTYLHSEMVEKIANNKIHVFCEKPVALSLNETKRMIKAIRINKVKGMVGHVLRFWPEYLRLKEIIEKEEMGKLLSIECKRLCTLRKNKNYNFNQNKDLGYGAALDVQIHDIDYLIWILGKPIFVNSIGNYDKNLGGWTHINSVFLFKNKINGVIIAEWSPIEKYPFTMTFRALFERGIIEWVRSSEGYEDFKRKNFPIKVFPLEGDFYLEKIEYTNPYYNEWKYFIDAIIKDKDIKICTFEDAMVSLSVALDTIKSCKKNYVKKL